MSKPYWTNRLATPDDAPAILRLVRIVHGEAYQEINETYWNWRYLNNTPFRAQIVMAEHEGQPIGIQPMAIFDWQRGEERMKGAMYTGVLTHPDHRRRGVFKSLVESSNDFAKSVGALFSMTLPNDASLPGFLKTKEWEYPGLIQMHMKVADGAKMLRPKLGPLAGLVGWMPGVFFGSKGAGRANDVTCRVVNDVPDDLEAVFDSFARDSDTLMIRRTAPYWRWRHLTRPALTYRTIMATRGSETVGAVSIGTGKRAGLDVGMIMDIVAGGGVPVLRALLGAAEEELRRAGIGLLSCQATTPLLREALAQEGYRAVGSRITRKQFHFVYRPTGQPGWERRPAGMADWHLTFSDSDNA